MRPGPLNLLSDVAGLTVGHAHDAHLRSGSTAILCEPAAIAAVHVMGGAPGTRETDLLAPENSVERINGLALSGGSAFGLDAASGVQARLRESGTGFAVGGLLVPIVPAAILFDLNNGGDKQWGRHSPYRELGYEAACNAGREFAIGSAGAGFGARVAGLRGGLGSASVALPGGITLAALAVVNAVGAVTMGDGPHFWASPFEIGSEFGGLGLPTPLPSDLTTMRLKSPHSAAPIANTTIAIIATDAELTKAQAKRLAVSSHDGFARAIWPSHLPFDGDLVFALATGASGVRPSVEDWLALTAASSAVMARAIARGVHAAAPSEGVAEAAWRERFG